MLNHFLKFSVDIVRLQVSGIIHCCCWCCFSSCFCSRLILYCIIL